MKPKEKTNKRLLLMSLMALIITMNVQAQVRIGEDAAPTKGAVLDLNSDNKTAGYVGGLKLPNVSLANLTDLSSFTEIPADVADLKGTIVYNTNLDSSAGLFPCVYQWDGAKWVIQATNSSGNATDAWLTTGNAGTDSTTNFIGTTDNQPLMFRTNNTYSGIISNTPTGSNSFGMNALANNTTGTTNNAFGGGALQTNTTGSNNVAIGGGAGSQITTGSNNIVIGTDAQVASPTDDYQISIGNLIYATDATGAGNGYVGIGVTAPAYPLDVKGDVNASGMHASDFWMDSDIRYKKNITTIPDPLDIVSQLRGTSYEFRTDEFPQKGFSEGKQLGVIAQEVEKVLPELVINNAEGYKTVNYNGFIPVLIEGMKAQQTQIELQQQIIEQLDARLKALEAAK